VLRVLIAGLISALVATAASPVATVTSAATFRISGAAVPVAGVPDWPLAAGDELVMGKAPGMIQFRDGTEIYVLPETKLKVGGSAANPALTLSRGGVAYRFAKNSSVQISALSTKVSSRDSSQGRLWFENGEAWWYPANAAFMLVVGERRRAGEPIEFVSRRMTPRNFGQVPAWRNYNPPWANKPGEPNPPPNEGLPPDEITHPERPTWISGREP